MSPGRPQRARQAPELVPILAGAFAQLGYRRATTAELARRCELRENQLYRIWPDKRAMFLAAIDYVATLSLETWDRLVAAAEGAGEGSAAETLLGYESRHQGEFGHYRILFAGLNEVDDPLIGEALQATFTRLHRYIAARIADHRGVRRSDPAASRAAWAFIGLGTVANITRELDVLGDRARRLLINECGQTILNHEE